MLLHRTSRWLAEHALVDLVPIAAVVLVGAVWIGLNGGKARGYTHLVLLSLTLVESAVCLYFRRRHPLGALVGVVIVYTIFQLPPTMVLPVLVALITVAVLRPARVLALAALGTAVVVIGRTYVNGGSVDFLTEQLPLLLAIGLTAALGIYLRGRRPVPGRPGDRDPEPSGEAVEAFAAELASRRITSRRGQVSSRWERRRGPR